MKKMIIAKIEKLGRMVSFVELEKIPGARGDQHLGRSGYNCVYWMNLSHSFVRAIHELIRDGIVSVEVTYPITYVIDGRVLNLPLWKTVRRYKSPRWLPVVLNKGPNFGA